MDMKLISATRSSLVLCPLEIMADGSERLMKRKGILHDLFDSEELNRFKSV